MKTKLLTLLTLLSITLGFAQNFSASGLDFNVISTNPNEVEITGGTSIPADLVIPEIVNDGTEDFTVTSIGFEAFRGNQISSVSIPNSITDIGISAFRSNQITVIDIPDNITTISAAAFRDNLLTTVTIPNGVITIGNNAFRLNPLQSVTISSSVTSIGEDSFDQTPSLTLVVSNATVPPTITASSFQNRSNITVIVPESTTQAYLDGGWTGFNSIEEVQVVPLTTPYIEDFETFTTSSNAFGAENFWTATSGAYFWEAAPGTDTGSSGTGPNPSITTGNYFYTEASGGSTGDITDLVSPLVNLTNLTTPTLIFNYHMFGSAIGTLDVLVNGTDNVLSLSGQQQTSASESWRLAIIDLSAYTGQTISITFRGTSAGTFEGDIAIDNVTFDELPSCSPVEGSAAIGTTDCTGANTFFIDVDVINLGDATTVTISNDAGIAPTDITTAGVVAIGPFNSGSTVNISLDHDTDPICSANLGNFTFNCPPPNDDCINAIALTIPVASTCPVNTILDTTTATEGTDELTSCDDSENLGLWYSFTAPASGQMEFTSGNGDPGIVIYEGTCDALTEVANTCLNNESGLIFGLTPGNPYFAMIWTDDPETNAEFCLFSLPCTAATATATIVEDCANNQFTVDVNIDNLGSSNTVTISNDSGVAPIDVTTTGIVNIGPFPVGTEVTITLEHETDTACNFVLPTVRFLCPPSNDECTIAELITQDTDIADVANATSNAGSLSGATDSGLAAESCNGFTGTADDDVWYTFEALTTDVNITIDATFDSIVQLYSGTCGALTVIDCADSNFGTGVEEISATGLTVGETYFIRIYHFFSNANTAGFNFDLSIWSPSTLGTNTLEPENTFTYYPNPVKNTLTLNAQKTIDGVALYNMLGQEVLRATPNTMESELDMSNLQNGTYFVKVTIKNSTKTIRVIKQ